jgi:hypothetical protein
VVSPAGVDTTLLLLARGFVVAEGVDDGAADDELLRLENDLEEKPITPKKLLLL